MLSRFLLKQKMMKIKFLWYSHENDWFEDFYKLKTRILYDYEEFKKSLNSKETRDCCLKMILKKQFKIKSFKFKKKKSLRFNENW